ncbi:MAG TPA: right-handed parallel beta-helix repeat-containing protein [Anaerolineae bacterium]|nr:right-handed parallel beta-helix repeat-containing protein [Anaerolineae bacterium]
MAALLLTLNAASSLAGSELTAAGAEPASPNATFIVNDPGDAADANTTDGLCDVDLAAPDLQCTLRAAIQEANAQPGLDAINFDLPPGSLTLQPASPLPDVSEAAIVDASTEPGPERNEAAIVDGDAQPGAVCPTPTVALDGVNAGTDATGLTLVLGSEGSTVRGLQIIRFDGNGIHLDHSDNHTIACNQIGTDAAGSPLGNGTHGIYVSGSRGNSIGGTTAAERNVIGRNNIGIALVGANSAENIVRGNYIGLAGVDQSGAPIAANNIIGIVIDQAQGNTVGGTAAGAGNVISGNNENGIWLDDSGNNTVQGNFIGTNATGAVALPNGANGIVVSNSPSSPRPASTTYKSTASQATSRGAAR